MLQAVAEHDDDYLAHFDLAEHLVGRRPAEAVATPTSRCAIDHYARSAELQPGNDWTLTRWGQALLRLEDPCRPRRRSFGDAIRLSGGNSAARQGLCEAEVPEPAARRIHPSCQRAAAIWRHNLSAARRPRPVRGLPAGARRQPRRHRH